MPFCRPSRNGCVRVIPTPVPKIMEPLSFPRWLGKHWKVLLSDHILLFHRSPLFPSVFLENASLFMASARSNFLAIVWQGSCKSFLVTVGKNAGNDISRNIQVDFLGLQCRPLEISSHLSQKVICDNRSLAESAMDGSIGGNSIRKYYEQQPTNTSWCDFYIHHKHRYP